MGNKCTEAVDLFRCQPLVQCDLLDYRTPLSAFNLFVSLRTLCSQLRKGCPITAHSPADAPSVQPIVLWLSMLVRFAPRHVCCSYGVCLWEVVTGDIPVRGYLRDVLVPQECPAEVRQLISDCMETESNLRPTAQELVRRGLWLSLSRLAHTAPRFAPLRNVLHAAIVRRSLC
jgi:hypothetical protein